MRCASLAQIWPQGVEGLLESLRGLGFSPSLPADSPLRQKTHWAGLQHPCGFEQTDAGPAHYTYLQRPPKTDVRPWGLVLADPNLQSSPLSHVIWVDHADAAMDFILRQVGEKEWTGPSAPLPAGVQAEAGVVLGPDCQIGEGTVLEAGVRLGARVRLGKGCRIGAHSRLADDTVLGEGCVLTGLASLGGQGFGMVVYPGQKTGRPRLHVGQVVLEDRVRLGAFVAIDRAVFGQTRVGAGSALDNLVQVAHNCTLGSQAVLCSFVGLSGSTHLGERVTLAGMVGTKGHLRIGHDVTVAAQTGVSRDIADGQVVKGYPPRPLKEALKISALVDRLPALYERLRILEKKLGKESE